MTAADHPLSAQGTRLNRRGLETRARVLDAALACLAEGPDAASANLVARHAVVGELVCVPPEARPDRDAAAGQMVERGDRLGERERVGLNGQGDRGREPDPAGDRGRHGEGHPRVERAPVAVVGQRLVPCPGVGRGPPHRYVRVLGHVERVEAGVLSRLRGLGRGDASVAGEQDDAVPHRFLPPAAKLS